MTREEILNMEPGRELNALVARDVMHQEVYLSREEWVKKGMPHIQHWNENVRYPAYWNESYMDSLAVADYSFDISAAMEIVEKCKKWFSLQWNGLEYVCEIGIDAPFKIGSKSAPEAICKAALLAMKGSEEA